MSIYAKHTDEELILLIKQERVEAFSEIYQRYWMKLYNSAYKRIRNNAVCEEIVQEVFVKCWNKRKELPHAMLSSYLFTAIRNGVIDFHRKSMIRADFQNKSRSKDAIDNSNEENIFMQDLLQLVHQVVGTLPPKCRRVYQLSRNEHKTNKEIADILSISEKTVEGHLTKALLVLKQNLQDLPLILIAFLIR